MFGTWKYIGLKKHDRFKLTLLALVNICRLFHEITGHIFTIKFSSWFNLGKMQRLQLLLITIVVCFVDAKRVGVTNLRNGSLSKYIIINDLYLLLTCYSNKQYLGKRNTAIIDIPCTIINNANIRL